jgi:uncharacterized phage protein (TIGR02220 family)
MGKRFIDTELFDDSWFMDLSVNNKLFFVYLITNCDHAGIIDLNIKLAEFKTGIKGLSENFEEIKNEFGDRLLSLRDNYFFIPKFIKYQYPHGLNENVKAQKSVIKRLSEFQFCDDRNKELKNSCQTLREVFGNCFLTVQDKDKDKDKDKIKEIVSFFNKTCGTKYKETTKSIIDPIKGRLSEGYTVDDFKTVIEKKYNDWKNDKKMSKYITPHTLFRLSKFPSYLNQLSPQKEFSMQLNGEDIA